MDSELVTWVKEHGGFAAAAEAERAIAATLEALAARLFAPERELLAEALPPRFAAGLRAADGGAGVALRVEDVVRDVARREGTTAPVAKEHVEVVMAAIGKRVFGEARTRLTRVLPPELAALWEAAPVAEAERPVRVSPRRRTLSTGRPGSEHPLSEARPDRTQSDSVVATDNPHAATKLSSAHGLTQEREIETLATGKPGPDRPLSEHEE